MAELLPRAKRGVSIAQHPLGGSHQVAIKQPSD